MAQKKRGNKEGTVFYDSTKESWRAQVTLDGHRLSHNSKTRQEAQEWLKETIAQIDTGLTFDGARTKLCDFLEDWLISTKPGLKPNTWYQYNMTAHNHILPTLGKIPLMDLRAEHIQKLYDKKLKEGTGARTVQFMHQTLHKALDHALRLGIIPRNPTAATFRPKDETKEMKIYDESQVSQLLMAVQGTRVEALYQLVLATGMRQSEVLALKWSDLDWKNQTITVRRQLVRLPKSKDEYFSTVKTNAGKRTITLGNATIESLRNHVNIQDEEKRNPQREKWDENDLIFPSITGTPMNQSNLYHHFKALIAEIGLPDIRFHDLRHTAASLMLNHGIAPMVVSKRLGHAKVSITLDTYGHLIPELHGDVAQMIDDFISPVRIPLSSNRLAENEPVVISES